MKVLSLFSGIGGFDLAFQRAGATHLAFCEIDKTAQSIIRRQFPNVKIISDVKTINKSDFSFQPDIIVGGFPCQDVSVAGLRAGLDGERSGLWFEFERIIDEYKPRWVVIENVPGLLSSWTPTVPAPRQMEIRDFDSEEDAQRWADSVASSWDVEESSDFETILNGLTKLGYCVSSRILDAQYDGLAQRRERVFIVASLGKVRGRKIRDDRRLSGLSAQVLFESDGRAWDSPPRREARQDVAATLRSGAALRSAGAGQSSNGDGLNLVAGTLSARSQAGAGFGTDFECNGGLVPVVAGTLMAGGAGTMRPANQRSESDFLIAGTVSSKWAKGVGGPAGDECSNLVAAPDIAHTLRGEGFDASEDGTGRGTPLVMAFTERTRAEGRTIEFQDELAYALMNPGSGGRTHSRQIAGMFGVRRLTPTECERLQGFPDDWTAFDDHGKPISDSARYRMLGNGVAVPVVEWIARRIVAVEQKEESK